MANNYTQTCTGVRVPDPANTVALYWTAVDAWRDTDGEGPFGLIPDDIEVYSVPVMELGHECVYLQDDGESVDIDVLCHVFQWLITSQGAPSPITFTWAETLSKSRPDAFGGGAGIVTATTIQTISTDELLNMFLTAQEVLDGSVPS